MGGVRTTVLCMSQSWIRFVTSVKHWGDILPWQSTFGGGINGAVRSRRLQKTHVTLHVFRHKPAFETQHMWAPNVLACYIGREFSSYNSETNKSCLYLVDLFSFSGKTKICCESSTVDTHWWAFNPPPELPKHEAGEMPHINHLRKFFVSHKVEATNNQQTRTAKLPEPKELAGWTARHSRTFKNLCNFWEISKSILSNPSLILSSWAHSPGPSCSFTSASSFW